MEAKRPRPAAMAALCVLLLLVLLPGQVAAKSKFCKCFDDCFPGCTNDHVPRLLCFPFCTNKCSPNQAAIGGDAMCRMACNKLKIKICGWSAAPAADAAICVENCNKKWSQKWSTF